MTNTNTAAKVGARTQGMPADSKIKALCLRNGFAMPTDAQLEQFPSEFRSFSGTDRTERLHMGLKLLCWLETGKGA